MRWVALSLWFAGAAAAQTRVMVAPGSSCDESLRRELAKLGGTQLVEVEAEVKASLDARPPGWRLKVERAGAETLERKLDARDCAEAAFAAAVVVERYLHQLEHGRPKSEAPPGASTPPSPKHEAPRSGAGDSRPSPPTEAIPAAPPTEPEPAPAPPPAPPPTRTEPNVVVPAPPPTRTEPNVVVPAPPPTRTEPNVVVPAPPPTRTAPNVVVPAPPPTRTEPNVVVTTEPTPPAPEPAAPPTVVQPPPPAEPKKPLLSLVRWEIALNAAGWVPAQSGTRFAFGVDAGLLFTPAWRATLELAASLPEETVIVYNGFTRGTLSVEAFNAILTAGRCIDRELRPCLALAGGVRLARGATTGELLFHQSPSWQARPSFGLSLSLQYLPWKWLLAGVELLGLVNPVPAQFEIQGIPAVTQAFPTFEGLLRVSFGASFNR